MSKIHGVTKLMSHVPLCGTYNGQRIPPLSSIEKYGCTLFNLRNDAVGGDWSKKPGRSRSMPFPLVLLYPVIQYQTELCVRRAVVCYTVDRTH